MEFEFTGIPGLIGFWGFWGLAELRVLAGFGVLLGLGFWLFSGFAWV